MARMRSPNFPGLSLEDAVSFVKIIWDKSRRASIMREAAAKDLGYTGLTGRSLKILGALNQYDLIENTAKGHMRVTKTAEDILIGYPEEVKKAAVTKAGHAPSLFCAIYDKFEGIVPSENAVRSFLLQNGFTNEGVEKAIRSFNDTNRYVEIYGVSESYGNASEGAAELSPEIDWETAKVETGTAPAAEPKRGGLTYFDSGPLDFNLSSTGLKVTGKTNSASELKTFIEKLKALAVLLPDEGTGEKKKSSYTLDNL